MHKMHQMHAEPAQLPSVHSRQDVIKRCQEKRKAGRRDDVDGYIRNGLPYNEHIWVKYSVVGVALSEAETQSFVHEHCGKKILYTPKVYDYFTHLDEVDEMAMRITYIVMERIHGLPLKEYLKQEGKENRGEILEKVAQAVREIWKLPIPSDTTVGIFGHPEQKPADRFFSDCGVGRTFDNVSSLQGWINETLTVEGREDRVDLSAEPMHLCHNDIALHNIKVEESGRIVILDWGCTGVYPRSFEEFAIFNQFNLRGSRFAKNIHRLLFGERPSKQIRPLALTAMINNFGTTRYLIEKKTTLKEGKIN